MNTLIVALVALVGTASAGKYEKFEARRPRPTVNVKLRTRAEAAPPPLRPGSSAGSRGTSARAQVNIKEASLLSVEATNLEGEVETRISDQIAAGATYDQNSAQFAPKALFTRWTAKGSDPLEVTGTFNIADQSAEVDVKYEKLGSKFGVNFNSARSSLITAARTSRDFSVEGRNVNVAPSYNFVTGVSSVKSKLALTRAGKESELPNFKGFDLGRFPLVSADFWTSDHLSDGLEAWMLFPERARAEHSC